MTISIPGYEIDREIGQGAMASVYLATQTSLARHVALKCMAPSLVSDQTFCDRFIVEGQIVAKLSHKNVVTIHDIGHSGNHYYMAMEYLPGGTLADRLDHPLPLSQAVEYVVEIAQALEYARKHAIVHRDIKPANILFRDEHTPILSDFGIAKALDGREQMTAAGTMMGTPNYMSPEQALGKQAGHQSDLYSLGIVFFEMLTGRKPYQSTDGFATALKHINDPIPVLPNEYAYLQPLLDQWLAKSTDDRIATAADLIQKLANVEDDQGATIVLPALLVEDKTQIHNKPNKTIYGDDKKENFVLMGIIGVAAVIGVGSIYTALNWGGGTDPGVAVTVTNPISTPVIIEPEKPLTPDELVKISELLEAAEVHFMTKRYATPSGSNALEAYQAVLALQPSNDIAAAGLREIANYYFQRANYFRDQDNMDKAREELEFGLQAQPTHPGLLTLQNILK